jgi:DTW domain-containing protein YfiP
MARETCYRCFWPKPLCWCGSIRSMATRTRFVLLMHPKEFKQEKAATGRLTHLCLANSEIQVGVGFDDHEAVQRLIAAPENYPVLLYPGENAHDLSRGGLTADMLQGRRLVVFLLDATWSCARKMLRVSPSLQRLPRVKFAASGRSRYLIKRQPQDGCLSTLEATHELLGALAAAGLDQYEDPAQLLGLFDRMQDYQIRCARASTGPRHGGRNVRNPAVRDNSPAQPRGESARRRRFLR